MTSRLILLVPAGLPQHRPQLFLQPLSGRKKTIQRLLHLQQPLQVRYVPASLQGEAEIRGGFPHTIW